MVKLMSRLIRKAASMLDSRPSAVGLKRSESEMEYRTRKERKFDETESKLPDVKVSPASDDRPSLATNLLSYLRSWNPVPLPISENDTVWLLDNTAYRNPLTNEWEAAFVAAVFDKDTGVETSTVVADLAEKLGIVEGDAAEERIKERLMPFMKSVLPGRVVKVDFGDCTQFKLGPGGRNGISSDIKALPEHKNGDILESSANVPQGSNGVLLMKTVYAEPEGWGIISDIDDTIKITQTGDPMSILRSTFVSDPTPVPGMPELYAYLHSVVTPAAPWFYLSASPYNLYSFLRDFRERHYPQGTMILRDANWMNLSGLLSNLTLGTQEYKVDRMEQVHTWLPQRKMILIGDSTQSDPESYGEIYRKHQGWVKLILIRRVDDIAAVGIDEKNKPDRFENAFKHVPRNVWHIFDEPKECYQIINDVVAGSRE